MDLNSPDVKSYLLELYELTEGDTARQASMFDVGERIGLDKDPAGSLAENLIVHGWLELVSLSGGISITTEGVEQLQLSGCIAGSVTSSLKLGTGPVVDSNGRHAIEMIVGEIKESLVSYAPTYDQLEEIVIDLKTVEVYMLSPKPKTEVLRGLLRSLQASLTALNHENLAGKIGTMISS